MINETNYNSAWTAMDSLNQDISNLWQFTSLIQDLVVDEDSEDLKQSIITIIEHNLDKVSASFDYAWEFTIDKMHHEVYGKNDCVSLEEYNKLEDDYDQLEEKYQKVCNQNLELSRELDMFSSLSGE